MARQISQLDLSIALFANYIRSRHYIPRVATVDNHVIFSPRQSARRVAEYLLRRVSSTQFHISAIMSVLCRL